MHFDLLHSVAGLLVGVLVGLTGVGGGSLMTPLLILLFGVQPGTAVGTDLLFASITKMAGSAVHHRRETVDWHIMRRLALGSVPAAVLTLVAIASFGKLNAEGSRIVVLVLGTMLIVTALATLLQKRIAAYAHNRNTVADATARVPTIMLGAVLGVAVSISSVGAGAFGVTVLLLLYPALRVAKIVGTDIAHAVPLTLVAGFGHWIIGDVDPVLLLNLLVGSLPGAVIGSMLSSRAPDALLRPALAAVLAFSGFRLLTS